MYLKSWRIYSDNYVGWGRFWLVKILTSKQSSHFNNPARTNKCSCWTAFYCNNHWWLLNSFLRQNQYNTKASQKAKSSSSYSTRSIPAVAYPLPCSTLHFFHPFLRPAYALVSVDPCLVINLLYMFAADGTQCRLANALLDSCLWMKMMRTVCQLYEHFQIERETFSLMGRLLCQYAGWKLTENKIFKVRFYLNRKGERIL